MKFVSWNVNGLRACLKKGFVDSVLGLDADFICLQETKMERGQAEVELSGYHEYWNSADKKGYSGTAIFAREEPLSVSYGMDLDKHDHEGRLITLEYPEFWLVDCYTPNAQSELARLGYRLEWEEDLLDYLRSLDKTKPVVYCGDLNVAHQEIDLKNPKPNIGNAGFSYEERGKFAELLACGFLDTFRHFHPQEAEAYSWWSYMYNSRQNNVGWRIDYFLADQRLAPRLREARILSHVQGSDHCPVELILEN